MPEQLNICCLFDRLEHDRYTTITSLFDVDPVWMGQPTTFMIFSPKEILKEGRWSENDPIIKQSLGSLFLAVYSQTDAEHPFRSCIVLEESKERAAYTLSMPILVLQRYRVEEAERRLVYIYRAASMLGPCSIFVGPEIEIDPSHSRSHAIVAACEPSSLVTWIILAEDELPTNIKPFEIVMQHQGSVLLRHPDAVSRTGVPTS